MTKQDTETKDSFVKIVEKFLTIKSACSRVGLSRQTIYRWMKDDKTFAHDVKEAIKDAVLELNDECEDRVIAKIRNDDANMIKFWLRYRHPDYKQSYIVTK